MNNRKVTAMLLAASLVLTGCGAAVGDGQTEITESGQDETVGNSRILR